MAEDITHFNDIPLKVDVELDRKTLTVLDLLNLDVGSVIKMTRSAGENIDIHIGGALVGFGEIVIIEDMMGVRITDFNGED
jgi:flagellar motor switch protein FliN/FliY